MPAFSPKPRQHLKNRGLKQKYCQTVNYVALADATNMKTIPCSNQAWWKNINQDFRILVCGGGLFCFCCCQQERPSSSLLTSLHEQLCTAARTLDSCFSTVLTSFLPDLLWHVSRSRPVKEFPMRIQEKDAKRVGRGRKHHEHVMSLHRREASNTRALGCSTKT